MTDLQKAKDERRKLKDELYYKPDNSGVRLVKSNISLKDRIILFESIQTLTKYIKENGKN